MFCRNCGNEISDKAVMCPKCNTQTSNVEKSKKQIPQYTFLSALCVLFSICFFLFSINPFYTLIGFLVSMTMGIASLIYSNKTYKFKKAMDFENAIKYSKNTLKIGLVGCVFAISFCLIQLAKVDNSPFVDKYVELVKNGQIGNPPSCPKKIFTEEAGFLEAKWQSIVSDNGEVYVNVEGRLNTTKAPKLIFQFKVISDSYFKLHTVEINGEPANRLEVAMIINMLEKNLE